MAAPATLHGIPQHVVTFTWRGQRARIIIDAHDDVPSALELAADDEYGIWGTVRTTYNPTSGMGYIEAYEAATDNGSLAILWDPA